MISNSYEYYVYKYSVHIVECFFSLNVVNDHTSYFLPLRKCNKWTIANDLLYN